MFTGIDTEICEIAFNTILPAIKKAADDGITNKLAGTIVVLDPRKRCVLETPEECLAAELFCAYIVRNEDGGMRFQAIPGKGFEYFEIGPQYTKIARSKAFVTFKHRMPASVVQQQFPGLYETGDTKWGGSTIDAGGQIVAFSGVQAVYDEMIAEWMASAMRALCRWGMTGTDGVMSAESAFIGG